MAFSPPVVSPNRSDALDAVHSEDGSVYAGEWVWNREARLPLQPFGWGDVGLGPSIMVLGPGVQSGGCRYHRRVANGTQCKKLNLQQLATAGALD